MDETTSKSPFESYETKHLVNIVLNTLETDEVDKDVEDKDVEEELLYGHAVKNLAQSIYFAEHADDNDRMLELRNELIATYGESIIPKLRPELRDLDTDQSSRLDTS